MLVKIHSNNFQNSLNAEQSHTIGLRYPTVRKSLSLCRKQDMEIILAPNDIGCYAYFGYVLGRNVVLVVFQWLEKPSFVQCGLIRPSGNQSPSCPQCQHVFVCQPRALPSRIEEKQQKVRANSGQRWWTICKCYMTHSFARIPHLQ